MRSGSVVSTPMSDCGLVFVYVACDCSQGWRPVIAPYAQSLCRCVFQFRGRSALQQLGKTLAAVEPDETGRRVGEAVGFALGSP